MDAKDLKIGMWLDRAEITNLAELCSRWIGPHVHVTTTTGQVCLCFGATVKTGAAS